MDKAKLDKLVKDVKSLWNYDLATNGDIISISLYRFKPQILLQNVNAVDGMAPMLSQGDVTQHIICEVDKDGVQFKAVVYKGDPEYMGYLEKYHQMMGAYLTDEESA